MKESILDLTDKKIMPQIGCLEKRLHDEKWLQGSYFLDPCIMCEKRSQCKKTEVIF